MHLVVERRDAPAELAKYLLARKEKRGRADLHCADGTCEVLHRGRRRVRTSLDLQIREGLLQSLRAALELPIHLSRGAELDAQRVVELLDGRRVIACYDVEAGEIHLLRRRLLIKLLEEAGADENGEPISSVFCVDVSSRSGTTTTTPPGAGRPG